uniref:Carboxylesterase type B domain-containing protein n=2 Tax=Trichobilharzia regenti TaxID=157069 RepID=A0AA85K2E5_TRIRE|nr:unnamed protein product [Trichobilharzia regenti]
MYILIVLFICLQALSMDSTKTFSADKKNTNNTSTLNKHENNIETMENNDLNVITLIDGKRLTGINLHLPLSSLNSVNAYYGIKYASLGVPSRDANQSPENANITLRGNSYKMPALHRFSHSVASFFYESLNGVHSYSVLPPACPQHLIHINAADKNIPKHVKDRFIRLQPFLRDQEEDCLTLNIYVPQNSKRRKSYRRPVFLFVHGESYEHGSGNAYDLSVLASYSDTIGITLNYRLGLLGFLSTNNYGVNGNFALYDLHAAIMWIKTNIKSFSGDPNEITLIGYGHGAALVHLFALSKMSQGPSSNGIKRIVLLNGSGFAPWATSHQSASVLDELLKHFNISTQSIKNNSTLNEIKSKKDQNRYKSLFAQDLNVNTFENFSNTKHASDSSLSSNNITSASSNLPGQFIKHLFLKLKNSSIEYLIDLQKNLSHSLVTTRLGPVISKHLFPSYLLPNRNLDNNINASGKQPTNYYTNLQQETHRYEQKSPQSYNGDSELKYRTEMKTSLFMNADLMVGWTESPVSNLYYLQSALYSSSPYSLLLNKIVRELYPNNQDVIKEIIEHIYCHSNEVQEADDEFSNAENDSPSSSHSNEKFKDNKCYQKMQEILSDGLYIVPIMQTLSMHAKNQVNQIVDKRTKTNFPQNMQMDNSSTNRKSTYALFFNHRSPKQSVRHTVVKEEGGQVHKIGFGDDLPYLFGAPLVSPNHLEPFASRFTEIDKKISVNIMNYLTNFIHYGDPNKEFIGHQTKKVPVHWSEYTSNSKSYLSVGSESKETPLFDQTKRQFRNLWGSKENEENLFAVKQRYETEKHKIWWKLLPRLTYLPKPGDDKNNESNEYHLYNRQKLTSEYFYFLQLKQTDWSSETMVKTKPTSNLWQNNNQNVTCPLNFVEDMKPLQTHISIPDISYSVNFSQLPLYVENDIDRHSNMMTLSTPRAYSGMLVDSNSSTEFYTIKRENENIESNSQSLTVGFSSDSYSTLIWIIGAGSVLFLLNTFIFIAIYHQAHQLRNANLSQQSKPTIQTSSIISGNGEVDTLYRNSARNTKEYRQMKCKDDGITNLIGMNDNERTIKVSSPIMASSISKHHQQNNTLSYPIQKSQQFDYIAYRNPSNSLLHEMPTNVLNINDNNSSNVNLMNSWYSESPSVIGQTTNTFNKTRYLHPYSHEQQSIQSNIYLNH